MGAALRVASLGFGAWNATHHRRLLASEQAGDAVAVAVGGPLGQPALLQRGGQSISLHHVGPVFAADDDSSSAA